MIHQIFGKTVKIFYQRKTIQGKEIFKWLVAGEDGCFYRADWEPDFTGLKTPYQRRVKRFSPSEIKWHRHETLGSAQRAFMHALLKGEFKLEHYSGLINTIDGRLRENAISLNDAGKDPLIMKLILQEIFNQIEMSKKDSMSESRKILSDLSTEKVPIGAKLAQVTALGDRFKEESFSLMAWVPEYLGRLAAIGLIMRELDKMIKDMEKQIALETMHEAFVRGRTSSNQVRILHHKLDLKKKALKDLSAIKQFREWVFLMLKDIETVKTLIASESLIQAGPIYVKMRESVRIKGVQLDIEKLIALISFDLDKQRYDLNSYIGYLLNLISRLKKINETGFEMPVCNLALEKLVPVFQEMQADRKERNLGISDLQQIKEELKQTYWLL